jgi:hypothetical protein
MYNGKETEVNIMIDLEVLEEILEKESKNKSPETQALRRAIKAKRKELKLVLEENGKDHYQSNDIVEDVK